MNIQNDLRNVLKKFPTEKMENENVKLESQKIQLALIDDIKSIEKQVAKLALTSMAEANKVESLYQKVNKQNKKRAQKMESLSESAFKTYYDARASFKELGVPVPKIYDNVADALSENVRKASSFVSNKGNIYSF